MGKPIISHIADLTSEFHLPTRKNPLTTSNIRLAANDFDFGFFDVDLFDVDLFTVLLFDVDLFDVDLFTVLRFAVDLFTAFLLVVARFFAVAIRSTTNLGFI